MIGTDSDIFVSLLETWKIGLSVSTISDLVQGNAGCQIVKIGEGSIS